MSSQVVLTNYSQICAVLALALKDHAFALSVTVTVDNKRVHHSRYTQTSEDLLPTLASLQPSLLEPRKKDRVLSILIKYIPTNVVAALTFTVPRYSDTGNWSEITATKTRDAFLTLSTSRGTEMYATATKLIPELAPLIK